MPELPEVETIARALAEGGRGSPPLIVRAIANAELLWARTLASPSQAAFLRRVRGQTVRAIGRRGKFLLLTLEPDTLLFHLRMSGDLRLEAPGAPTYKHDRLILHFTDGWRLAFNDSRKFGRAWLAADPAEVLGGLGPEPLDSALTPAGFHAMLSARKRLLKPLLLDQTFLAGLGNIYTDEALHTARLHPLRLSNSLEASESAALLEAIRAVLGEGIRANGASIDWVYRGGDFQNAFRAYGRVGLPCPCCGELIQRLVVGQRGTHICPNCQTPPPKIAC
jgi:formamidopyrimidine-DNA glycosylase